MLGGDASHRGVARRTTRSTTIDLGRFIAVLLRRVWQCGGDIRNRGDTGCRQQVAALGNVAFAVTVAVTVAEASETARLRVAFRQDVQRPAAHELDARQRSKIRRK